MIEVTSSPEFKRFVITNPWHKKETKEVTPAQRRSRLHRDAIEDHKERQRLQNETKEVWV